MLELLTAQRIVSAHRRGSSRPILVETERGTRLVKLRGAAQGTAPLVAEIVVGAIADALGLHVPPRCFVMLAVDIETAEWDDELADLLAASEGLNLGFDFLEGARDLSATEAAMLPRGLQAEILWLDRFVMNLDRTPANPNLLEWGGTTWLIDHGAALPFQYDWARVREPTPREARLSREAHVCERTVSAEALARADAALAPRVTREVLHEALAQVPDSFLLPLLGAAASEAAASDVLARRREAYVAYLWKRLASPRAFAAVREPPEPVRRGRPAWLG